ncbi:MAG: glutamate synthase-related protein, partial [Candidatus Puniceispirillaceae bacterium]
MLSVIWGRYTVWLCTALISFASLVGAIIFHSFFWILAVVAAGLFLLGCVDYMQKRRGVIANYPLLGRMRYLLESIRPELRQYFWEADTDELPYSRNQRAMVYQRAKGILAARPLGTVLDIYREDYNWLNHSMVPSHIENKDFRVCVGEGDHAYDCAILNISGTSFGAMSPPAIQALNSGARLGGFAHNTGEGAFSKYHAAGGGDVIWQISTGYFGCRTADGRFDADIFAKTASQLQIKMIEIKLSQGAKPGHGGMLLAPKVTPEIAETRGIKSYEDCISPPRHSEFSTPRGLLEFADRLRQLSGGKPVGIKLCIGHPWEFAAIVKAMVETDIAVDFITVDGS